MKIFSIALFAALLAGQASIALGDIDNGQVVCDSRSGANDTSLTVQVAADGSRTAQFSFNGNVVELNPTDIQEASIQYRRLNFIFGHHNTVIKLSADSDIFGGDAESPTDSEGRAPYRGYLSYESGNGPDTHAKYLIPVSCAKTR